MSFSVKDGINKASALYQRVPENLSEGLKSVKENGAKALSAAKDAFEAVKHGAAHGINHEAIEELVNPNGKLNLLGRVGVVKDAAGVVASVMGLPEAISTANKDIREAVRSGSREDVIRAVHSGGEAAKAVLETTEAGLKTATTAAKLGSSYHAASAAFRAAAPTASASVAKAAATAAMKATFEGASRQVVRAATREAALDAAKAAGRVAEAVVGSGSRAAARAAIASGSKAAASAAMHAGERVAVGTLGKAASRFVPGMNVAMAAIDTGVAVATLADPKAGVGKKVTSVITAAGSIAAATNIPVVSQVGAAVSTVSGIVGAFFK